MAKIKVEYILIIILIPILVYVGWQAYNTYLKPPDMDIEELELIEETEQKPPPAPAPGPPGAAKKMPDKPTPSANGTLTYSGYTKRDPLMHSIPVIIKVEKPPVTKVPKKEKPEKEPPKKEPPIKKLTKKKLTKKELIKKKLTEKILPIKKLIKKKLTEKKPPKPIVLPKFSVTGIVWGKAPPRAIIDDRVYKIGDIIKGAKILGVTERGIHVIYEGKEFWVTVQQSAKR